MKIIKNNKKINKVKLKDLCEINLGQSPNSESYSQKESDMPFFQGAADFTEKYTKIRYYTDAPKKTAFKGDLLMTVRAPVGRVNLANVDCAIGRGVCSFRFEDESLKKYMYHYLCNLYRNNGWGGDVQGAIFEAVNKNNIEEKLIALDLDSYSKVSYFLSLFENRLMKLKKLIKKIEIRNQYYAENLLNGNLTVKNMNVTKIKNIDYKNIKLKDIVDISIGTTPKEEFYDGDIPWITISDLGNEDFENSKKKLTKNVKTVEAGSLLVSFKLSVGVSKITTKEVCTNEAIIRIEPSKLKNNVSIKYLYYYLPKVLLDNAGKNAYGANILNTKQINNLDLKIFQDHSEITMFLDKLDFDKIQVEKLLKLEKKRFEWLSDKLLSGEYIIED